MDDPKSSKPKLAIASVVPTPAERELSEVNAFLDAIVENIPHMIFVKDAEELAFQRVNRAGEGQLLDTPMQALRYLSVDLTNKHFAPIIGEVKARSLPEAGEFHRHDGEEFVYVIAGELELHSESYTPLNLRAGDSVYFDSGMAHAYVSVGKERCKILSICTAPYEQAANRPEHLQFRRTRARARSVER